MPFPGHDSYWTEVADFIRSVERDDDTLMAPDEFAERFRTVFSYNASRAANRICVTWVVVHKGLVDHIGQQYLAEIKQRYVPVFANAVFVVFSARHDLPCLTEEMDHYRSFLLMLETLQARTDIPAIVQKQPKPVRAFCTLDVDGVREEMNRRYSQSQFDAFGGYDHPLVWDKVRFTQVNRAFAKQLGSSEGLDVLELGCGIGRNVSLFESCRSYVGVDLSDVAIAKVRRLHGHRPNFAFRQMDAMRLDFPDACFDRVVAIELIEHLQEAERMLREVYRVLRPGSQFHFDCTNRDSMHLRMIRKLGLPEFRGTYEHFREFGYSELTEILRSIGYTIEGGEGIFLLPYRGLPGVDARIDTLSQDDPEVVEMLRHLGERAGPEYGFEFVITASKGG